MGVGWTSVGTSGFENALNPWCNDYNAVHSASFAGERNINHRVALITAQYPSSSIIIPEVCAFVSRFSRIPRKGRPHSLHSRISQCSTQLFLFSRSRSELSNNAARHSLFLTSPNTWALGIGSRDILKQKVRICR